MIVHSFSGREGAEVRHREGPATGRLTPRPPQGKPGGGIGTDTCPAGYAILVDADGGVDDDCIAHGPEPKMLCWGSVSPP